MPPWFLYSLIVVCLYLGIVEPIRERVSKKELILEHFWIIPTISMWGERLTRKDLKRLMVAEYLFVVLMAAYILYFGESALNFKYEFEIAGWPRYVPIPFLLYLAVVEPILERVLKKELVLEHFWIIPSEALTDRQLKRRWIIAYLGVLFILVP